MLQELPTASLANSFGGPSSCSSYVLAVVHLYHLISSNSWCQNSCVRPSCIRTSRARYSGSPHFPLIVPVSPRHSERRPDSLTFTLAPIRACSDLMRTPPALHYTSCASLGVGASGAIS